MNLKITVDLTDLYTDDGQDIADAIKEHLVYKIKELVYAKIQDKIEHSFSTLIIQNIQEKLDTYISSTIQELTTTHKLKTHYNTKEKISFHDYICVELEKRFLNDRSTTQFLTANLKKTTDTISKELKERYDMMFASQIVAKLHENGMLKEDVAKLLLNS